MDFDKFESDMLAKIDAGEHLTERELGILTLDFEVETIEHGTGRWHTHVETICELCDRTFSVKWDRGLTERQENEYYNQPVEVHKRTYVKPVVVTEWIPVDK